MKQVDQEQEFAAAMMGFIRMIEAEGNYSVAAHMASRMDGALELACRIGLIDRIEKRWWYNLAENRLNEK